ncbi:MAG: hypothetical protein QW101_02080 [Ignisphaera sp.]|uniref:ATPase n=1 Tax=Ignisphaera aggregans TaxID=334771 RepID=A0A7J3MYI7_9CREN
MKVLITGLMVYDSGKTWFTVTLARKLISKGFKISIYKPVSGHSLWHQYSTIVESIEKGMLFGEDILKYGEVLDIRDSKRLALMNPIDILFAPLDIVKYIDDRNIEKALVDLDNQFLQMILARVSFCPDGITKHYVFGENTSRTTQTVREVIESLAKKFNAIETDVMSFNRLLQSKEVDDKLSTCLEMLTKGNDAVLIESFNNSLIPYMGLIKEEIDLLFVVYPSVVLIYRSSIKDLMRFVTQNIHIYGGKALVTDVLVNNFKYDKYYVLKPRVSIYDNDEIFDDIIKYIAL